MSASERISNIKAHLAPKVSARDKLLEQLPDDVVICSAVRTPFAKGKKGSFRETCPEELLLAVLHEVAVRGKCDKQLVEEVQVGNCLPPGGGASLARMAQLAAGFPISSTTLALNRQCASGLSAVNHIALQIMARQIDVGIGAGVESMSLGNDGPGASAIFPEKMSSIVLSNPPSADCLLPMGITSENVASAYHISRDEQDAFAAESYQKAEAAQKAGKFKEEIVPVTVTLQGKKILVTEDEGIRPGVTKESLSKLKPAFSSDGSTHAGNASQVTDGAAAVLLARRSVAQQHGLPILGKYCASVVAGVEPKMMGIGPAFAIPKLLQRVGLPIEDVDFFEINEAFASQVVMTIKALNIPLEKINPVGGAIALGHPLGATGARQIATGMVEARRSNKRIFVTSMCLGSGMGMAALFVRE